MLKKDPLGACTKSCWGGVHGLARVILRERQESTAAKIIAMRRENPEGSGQLLNTDFISKQSRMVSSWLTPWRLPAYVLGLEMWSRSRSSLAPPW